VVQVIRFKVNISKWAIPHGKGKLMCLRCAHVDSASDFIMALKKNGITRYYLRCPFCGQSIWIADVKQNNE